MSLLEKIATYLRVIEKAQSLAEAQREARQALDLIEANTPKRRKR